MVKDPFTIVSLVIKYFDAIPFVLRLLPGKRLTPRGHEIMRRRPPDWGAFFIWPAKRTNKYYFSGVHFSL